MHLSQITREREWLIDGEKVIKIGGDVKNREHASIEHSWAHGVGED